MTLVYDQRGELADQPGLHVFIVGVGAYPHLVNGGNGGLLINTYGLQPLSSTTLSAFKVYQWILNRKDNFKVPLATIRLLVSPSQAELEVEPQLNGLADPATQPNFLVEASQWAQDASTNPANVTLFYFAGHGVQRSKEDAVLLMNDFGDGIGGTLSKAVETRNLFDGMAASSNRPNMALTQFYFVDACRVLPDAFKNFEKMTVPNVFDIELTGRDNRTAPIFFAAIPGTVAQARKKQQTFFCEALLNCLQGIAGESLPEDEEGRVKWHISVFTLSSALAAYIDGLNKSTGANQDIMTGGITKNATIVYLDGPPLVEVTIEVDPLEALNLTNLEVRDYQDQMVWQLPAPASPYPYLNKLPAGTYRIKATINPPTSGFQEYNRTPAIMPPRASLKARVKTL